MTRFAHMLAVIVAFSFVTGVIDAGEPRMIDAINALRRAKTSADPWKDLNQAAQDLRFAGRNKRGYRHEALSVVESAIATRPDKITLDRMIDDAIAKAEKGASVSHHRKR